MLDLVISLHIKCMFVGEYKPTYLINRPIRCHEIPDSLHGRYSYLKNLWRIFLNTQL